MGFQNFYATKLQTAIGASDTTIQVATPPTVTSGRLVLEPRNAQQREIISFTGVSGTTLTGVTRGLAPTTAKPHSGGVLTEMNFLAQDYTDLTDAFNSFAASNGSGWYVLPQAPTVISNNGQKEHVIRYTGVDYSGVIPTGAKLKIPRTGTTPTTSMGFVAASSQYATKATASGLSQTDDITAEAMVYIDSYTGVFQYVVCARNASLTGWFLALTGLGVVTMYGGNGTTEDYVASYQSVPLNKWTHIAASMDLSASSGKVYIDGVEVPGAYFNSAATSFTAPNNIRIGANQAGTETFNGRIANARVWSTVRTAAQIRDNMYQETPASTTGLIGHWKGNGSWNDSSVNANHLTAVGGAINNYAAHPYSATEYAIATKVQYTGGNTDVTIFTGNSFLPNETLGVSSYSTARTPLGFPSSKSNWTVRSLIKQALSQTNPAAGSSYYLGVALTLPLGEWDVKAEGLIGSSRGAAGIIEANQYLSTTTSSTGIINGSGISPYFEGSNTRSLPSISRTIPYVTSAQVPIYSLLRTAQSGQNNIEYRGDYGSGAQFVLEAECTYL